MGLGAVVNNLQEAVAQQVIDHPTCRACKGDKRSQEEILDEFYCKIFHPKL